MTLQEKKIEKLEELVKHYEDFVRILSVSAILKHGEESKEFVAIRNIFKEHLTALDKEIEQGEEEPNDAHLLQDIYDRNGMDLIVQSDIYLRGFEDGLGYNKAKKHGGMGSCPECGNSVYNCKCQ